MGKFIGRDMLLDHIEQFPNRTSNEIKGLRGEIEVGDLLAKYLPDDTFIIAQPTIGKYEPDFLVISPRYGFRIIEVKNWSLNIIKGVQTNGTFTILSNTDSPLQQVRKHAEDLKGYLSSSHPDIGDPYKLIGYATIQYGFSRRDIDVFTKTWDDKNSYDFFKFHIFKDELDSQLDNRLSSASKFGVSDFRKSWIEDIIRKIRISNNQISDSDINIMIHADEINQTATEMKELNEKTVQMLEEQRKITIAQNMNIIEPIIEYISIPGQNDRHKVISYIKNLIFIITIITVAIISINSINRQAENSNIMVSGSYVAYSNSNIQQAFTKSDNIVKVVANVETFRNESMSGTKFLKLKADGFIFNAIIFKDTKTPYINQGKTYTFHGVTQEYEGQTELKITKIE